MFKAVTNVFANTLYRL